MATGTLNLPLQSVILPDGSASNAAPGLVRRKSSASAPSPYWVEAQFDASTDEMLMWSFRMPANYVSDPLLKVQYKMTSATSGTVCMEGRIAAVTPYISGANGDAQDVDAKAFAATNFTSETVLGTAGYLQVMTITLTNADSVAANDFVTVWLNRDADGTSGSDTATGDMEVVAVSLEYTSA